MTAIKGSTRPETAVAPGRRQAGWRPGPLQDFPHPVSLPPRWSGWAGGFEGLDHSRRSPPPPQWHVVGLGVKVQPNRLREGKVYPTVGQQLPSLHSPILFSKTGRGQIKSNQPKAHFRVWKDTHRGLGDGVALVGWVTLGSCKLRFASCKEKASRKSPVREFVERF